MTATALVVAVVGGSLCYVSALILLIILLILCILLFLRFFHQCDSTLYVVENFAVVLQQHPVFTTSVATVCKE